MVSRTHTLSAGLFVIGVSIRMFCFTPTPANAQRADTNPSTIITNAAAVRRLNPAQASQHIPVRLRGVALAAAPAGDTQFVVDDGTDPIYLLHLEGISFSIDRGDVCEIEGFTDPGGFAPYVVAERIKKAGRAPVPEPQHVTLEDLGERGLDAQWVEVSGVIRSCEPVPENEKPNPPPAWFNPDQSPSPALPPGFKLTIAAGNERLAVQFHGVLAPEKYVDAEVRIRGIAFSQHSANRQFLNPLLSVSYESDIIIVRPPAAEPFITSPLPVAALMQFDPDGNSGHRVHIHGVVTFFRSGESLWLRDGSRGLHIETAQRETLVPGDEVDVVGFPVRGQYTPRLEDAVFRRKNRLSVPVPVTLTNRTAALSHDADLVQLDARLTEIRPIRNGWALTLAWDQIPVEAILRMPPGAELPKEWLSESRLRVAGICSVLTEKSGPISGIWEPNSFQLLLRSTADVAVLESPSWWNHEHIAWVLGLIAGVSLLGTAAMALRSRRRLKEQANRRLLAEAEFAAILSERNRVAREIHDTLAQGLTATSVQLRLVRKHANSEAEPLRHHLELAQNLVKESLDEARNSIWNMRSQVLESGDLAHALNELLKHMTDGLDLKAEFKTTGKVRRLAPVIENNVLRIGQEAITNATRHAQARHLTVSMDWGEKELQMKVCDDGKGFDTTRQPASAGSFGLMGMRERATELKARFDAVSSRDRGTEINLVVPLITD